MNQIISLATNVTFYPPNKVLFSFLSYIINRILKLIFSTSGTQEKKNYKKNGMDHYLVYLILIEVVVVVVILLFHKISYKVFKLNIKIK